MRVYPAAASFPRMCEGSGKDVSGRLAISRQAATLPLAKNITTRAW